MGLRRLAYLCGLPSHGLPPPIASDERSRVPVIGSFHFSVCVLRATHKPEGYNHSVAVFVNHNILGGIGALPFRCRGWFPNAFHDVGLVSDDPRRSRINHVIGKKLIKYCSVAASSGHHELTQ